MTPCDFGGKRAILLRDQEVDDFGQYRGIGEFASCARRRRTRAAVFGDDFDRGAAAALYDTLIRFIRQGLRVILVVGLVIAAAAFFIGPSAAAVRSRRTVTSGIDWVRTRGEHAGVRTGPVGEWTGAHKTILRVGAVALVALIFVFWGQPTVAVVIWLVVLLLVLLGLIELIGGRSGGTAPAANP